MPYQLHLGYGHPSASLGVPTTNVQLTELRDRGPLILLRRATYSSYCSAVSAFRRYLSAEGPESMVLFSYSLKAAFSLGTELIDSSA